MVLSRSYLIWCILGWGLLGGVSFLNAYKCIGGCAIFFMLVALASWSVFPIFHLCVAFLVARKMHADPSGDITAGIVLIVLVFLVGLLMLGGFNYV